MPSTHISSTNESVVGAWHKIAEFTANSTSATVTFSSIPQNFNHLLVMVNMRTTLTGGSPTQHSYINPNGDTTAANYEFQEVRGIAAVPAGIELVDFEGFAAIGAPNDAPANSWGYGYALIFGYKQTTFHKVIMGGMGGRWLSTTSGMGAVIQTSIWLSTAAITSVNLVAEGGLFLTGSKFRLYGVR